MKMFRKYSKEGIVWANIVSVLVRLFGDLKMLHEGKVKREATFFIDTTDELDHFLGTVYSLYNLYEIKKELCVGKISVYKSGYLVTLRCYMRATWGGKPHST